MSGPPEAIDIRDAGFTRHGGSRRSLLWMPEANAAPDEHSEPWAAQRNDSPEPWELPLIDTADWIGCEPEPQAWILPGWLARGTACMFVGEDGVGKSLLGQQLVTSVAARKPLLGLQPEQMPSIYVTYEDDANVLHMRQRAINRALGLPVDCAPAMLSSLKGFINVDLGAFDNDGRFNVSPCFAAIERRALDRKAGLIVLDNVAHLFTGNENIRQQVAAFCSALDRLAINCNAAVVMLGHPNKAGAEYSGSTGWSAHVRQRWFMERPEGGDCDARILRKSKSNYSEAGTEIAFRWHDWAFIREEDLPADTRDQVAATIASNRENDAFLECLRARDAQGEGRGVGPSPSANYAPSQFEGMPQARGLKSPALKRAMNRLFAIGLIETFEHRNAAKGRSVTLIREVSRKPQATPNAIPNASRTLSSDAPEQSDRTPPHTHPYINITPGGPDGPQPGIDDDDFDPLGDDPWAAR